MRKKPHILLNRHRHTAKRFRCFWGRYNGYADTMRGAYEACIRCAWLSKHLAADQRRYPQLRDLVYLYSSVTFTQEN